MNIKYLVLFVLFGCSIETMDKNRSVSLTIIIIPRENMKTFFEIKPQLPLQSAMTLGWLKQKLATQCELDPASIILRALPRQRGLVPSAVLEDNLPLAYIISRYSNRFLLDYKKTS